MTTAKTTGSILTTQMIPESDEHGSRVERVARTCTQCAATFQGHRVIIRAVDPDTNSIDEIARDFGRLCPACMNASREEALSEKQLAFKRDREKAWLTACPECYRNEWIQERIAKPTDTTPAGKHFDKVRLVREALNAGKGCYLLGPSGAFKTTAIYHGAIKALVWKQQPFISKALFEWRAEMIRAANDKYVGIARAIRPYISIPYLFLDDLGNMAGTASSEEALHLLMEGRMRANRPVFITAQFDHGTMIKKFKNEEQGAAVMRRIAHLTGTPIKCAV